MPLFRTPLTEWMPPWLSGADMPAPERGRQMLSPKANQRHRKHTPKRLEAPEGTYLFYAFIPMKVPLESVW